VNRSSRDNFPRPEKFPVGSTESRAAARALAEQRESVPYHCIACLMAGMATMDSNRPEFIPSEDMKKEADFWVRKCSKHRDPDKEATRQALIESGLLEGPIP
jgi:hypothetical protein